MRDLGFVRLAVPQPVRNWIAEHKVQSLIWLAAGLVLPALVALIWLALPELLMSWTDRLVSHAAKHVHNLQIAAERMNHPTKVGPDDLESEYWTAANAYWFAAADLAYHLSIVMTVIGVSVTVVVVVYGARQVTIGTNAMRSSARQQQMRLLFDLDLALLQNPEILALAEGRYGIDEPTLLRAKSSAFGHAFLNACDTVYDYYINIDIDSKLTHWPAWKNQLEYYLLHRPELRSIATESVERGFYTEKFRSELLAILGAAEQLPELKTGIADIVIAEPRPRPVTSPPILRELKDRIVDIETLTMFYETVYQREFPDPNERESLANMLQSLRLKDAPGQNDRNNYHIVVAELNGAVAGLCVSDFLANANAGVIEFLVVSPEMRGGGIGKQLLDFTENLMIADARQAGLGHPRGLVAELNDPFRSALHDDNLDPFDRAMVWHEWGFRRLHMPYVQPVLSADQKPVEILMLACKPLLPPVDRWPGSLLRTLIRDYLIYAMRIPEPDANLQFAAMAAWLDRTQQVPLLSLAAYVGRKPAVPWIEIRDRRDPAFDGAMKLYSGFFEEAGISIGPDDFTYFLDMRRRPDLRYTYHLWVAPEPVGNKIAGFASFFTLGRVGFGGYALRAPRDKSEAMPAPGNIPLPGAVALASVEERMRRDNPSIFGWLVECSPTAKEQPGTVFYRHGFWEVALEYRQPPLPGSPYSFGESPVLQLLYKPFGGRFGPPALTVAEFLAAMEDVFRVVYNIRHPAADQYHRHLRVQLSASGNDLVPFHPVAPRDRGRPRPA
jgi:GNAT superfamily N-acetyltransferase